MSYKTLFAKKVRVISVDVMSQTGDKRQVFKFSLSGSLAFGNGVEPIYDVPEPQFVPKLKRVNPLKVLTLSYYIPIS